MKIVDIRDIAAPIKSNISNAFIDFSHMTVSVVALITDVVREGKPVVGFGFSSNGRTLLRNTKLKPTANYSAVLHSRKKK